MEENSPTFTTMSNASIVVAVCYKCYILFIDDIYLFSLTLDFNNIQLKCAAPKLILVLIGHCVEIHTHTYVSSSMKVLITSHRNYIQNRLPYNQ